MSFFVDYLTCCFFADMIQNEPVRSPSTGNGGTHFPGSLFHSPFLWHRVHAPILRPRPLKALIIGNPLRPVSREREALGPRSSLRASRQKRRNSSPLHGQKLNCHLHPQPSEKQKAARRTPPLLLRCIQSTFRYHDSIPTLYQIYIFYVPHLCPGLLRLIYRRLPRASTLVAGPAARSVGAKLIALTACGLIVDDA